MHSMVHIAIPMRASALVLWFSLILSAFFAEYGLVSAADATFASKSVTVIPKTANKILGLSGDSRAAFVARSPVAVKLYSLIEQVKLATDFLFLPEEAGMRKVMYAYDVAAINSVEAGRLVRSMLDADKGWHWTFISRQSSTAGKDVFIGVPVAWKQAIDPWGMADAPDTVLVRAALPYLVKEVLIEATAAFKVSASVNSASWKELYLASDRELEGLSAHVRFVAYKDQALEPSD